MPFLHDGKDSVAGTLDGGTASILSYATASVAAPGPEGQSRPMAGHEGICCHINTTTGETSIFAAGQAPGDEKISDALFQNRYAALLAPDVGSATPGDRPRFHQELEQFSQSNYDLPAARYQGRFDSQSTVVAAFALVISLLVLMDWGTGGNDFFQPLGDWKKIINWDSMSCAGLVCLVFWVLSLRGKQVLSGWLDNRYLAEKLRCAGVHFESGVPLWSVMRRNPLDPSYSQLERVWHSLYVYWQQQYLAGDHAPLSSAALKRFLLSEEGLFRDQLAWHLRKADQKSGIQARYGWGRTLLFGLSLFVSATAAAIVVLEIESADYANMLDVASSFLSLLLAGVATLGQLKEHGKVARRYRHTARQLATVQKAIEYTQMGREEQQLAALRHHVMLGARVLMQTTDSWMFTMKEKDVDFT